MVGELTWRKRLLGLWLPLAVFLVVALFPFTWMAATSLKTNAELYNPKAIRCRSSTRRWSTTSTCSGRPTS